jgi:protein-arginine kinase activator protein McsA
MSNSCDRCGHNCGWFNLTEMLESYKVGGIFEICNKCASKANSFVNYYGVKKEKDRISVFNFLLSGAEVQKRYLAYR